jgi:hypothetical protein
MVIFTTLFGYIYELALARNEPQFSHSLDLKPTYKLDHKIHITK